MSVGLVACGAKKRNAPSLARDLYVGPVFLASAGYIQRRCGTWAILSAAHGVLLPSQVVAPYDVTLNKMNVEQRREWGERVRSDLQRLWPGARFLVVAGARYMTALDGLPYDAPFAGLSMGRLLHALKEAT